MKSAQASSTALLIARCLLLADRTPSLRSLLSPNAAGLTQSFLGRNLTTRCFDIALRYSAFRALLFTLERLALPGVILHYLVRKQMIEAHARAAIENNIHQIVVLGAGLDTLAWRLQTQATTTFELDHPATQSMKRRARLTHSPVLLAADFTRDSPASILRASGAFETAAPTLFVAEGLLMYFSPENVVSFLRDIAQLAVPGSRLVFTFMEKQPGQPIGFQGSHRLIDTWLRARSEPYRWSLACDEVATFLAPLGWKMIELSSATALRLRFLSTPLDTAPLAEGESIVLAERIFP